MTLRLIVAALLTLLAACSTTREVRLDTGEGHPLIHPSRSGRSEPVKLEKEEFTQAIAAEVRHKRPLPDPERAARDLFDVPPRSGWYGYTHRQGIVPLDQQPPASQWAEIDARVTQEYLRFCEAIGKQGDCRKVLMNSTLLTGDGRYALVMSFAMDEVLPEMMEAFKDMANPEELKATLYWTMTLYAAMWMAPEPVFSKGLATVVTATFICYVGVDTFWTLLMGWRQVVDAADNATSFLELRDAGKKYGKVMGKNAARAFALLLTTAIGQTASSFSAQVPTLPGSAQASVVAGAQVGIRLTEVAQVESVTVSADTVTIALAPHAVASTAKGMLGAAAAPVEDEGPEHHIATDKWTKDPRDGGPWTPRFQEIFDRAGMSLNDPANKVRVRGHMGPHPQEYHEEIYRRLDEATTRCRTLQSCGEALTAELRALAEEISTPDTWLNRLVTRAP